MICTILLLTLLQDGPAPTSQPTTLAGQMRTDFLGLQEVRRREEMPDGSQKTTTELLLKFRVAGSRVPEVRRHGSVVLTEVTDDAGGSLVTPEMISQAEQEKPRRQQAPQDRLEQSGVDLPVVKLKAPARSATKLASLKGSVRLIYAGQPAGVYFDNPQSWFGRKLENPKLKQLGIEIEVLAADEPPQMAGSKRHVAYRVLGGAEFVHDVSVVDGYLRPLRARTSPGRTAAGEECQILMAGEDLGPEHTLVVEVYPSVEDVRVPLEMKDVALP